MYDIIIKNGLIVDGTAGEPYDGAVCVKDGRISKIIRGAADGETAETVFDAKGRVIAPGFIDIHTHSDYSYLFDPTMIGNISSGVTFVVSGNCGRSPIPVRDTSAPLKVGGVFAEKHIDREMFDAYDVTTYGENIAKHGCTTNYGALIGHGFLRNAIIGMEKRDLTDAELTEMCDLADKMLEQGALGISLGLIYAPGSFCRTEELISLAKVVKKHDKLICVHMRNENDYIFEAIDEMIEIGRKTGCRIEISHLKLMGKRQWGKSAELLAKIDRARASGIRITCDQYPYTSSSSGIASCYPVWALDGGFDALADRCRDDATWEKIVPELLEKMDSRGGAENIIPGETGTVVHPEFIGKNLPQIADEMGLPLLEAIRQMTIICGGNVKCFYNNMSEEDVLAIMSRTDICTISDGTTYDVKDYVGAPHPRNIGTFPRFFRLVREHNLMPLQSAVARCTSLPASVIRVDDEYGFIKEGYAASITVFDPDNITDKATYENGALLSEGIDLVLVNGEIVFKDGAVTSARPGRLVKR